MRALAAALAVSALVVSGSGRAASPARCPDDASLGTVTFVKAGHDHRLSLDTCTARTVPRRSESGQLRSAQGKVATITGSSPHAGVGSMTIRVDGKPVYRVREVNGVPGPLGLISWSPDGRFVLFFIDPMSSASIMADGLPLQALDVRTGRAVQLTRLLLNEDYLSWCGPTLVVAAGGDRIATHHKRLVALQPPRWRERVLWRAPVRAFGSVACAPDGKSVAVLSQRDSVDARFFDTRWQLWQVSLDGTHRVLDRPPAGYADESPAWSPDGRSLLFVREHDGRGRLMLLHGRTVFGPLADLGYSLGYYGHHDWWLGASWSAGA